MTNHLSGQSSPYLLQHAENPVDWYPWRQEAFDKAAAEDKPVFLSIGYSTCHWCHVMAHESFEDSEIAELLNRYFIAIKVDKEERPDIDSIYMAVCQALTGSGGWPTSIFMTPERKPFFAGTYFPKTSQYGTPGLKELLITIDEKWKSDRTSLLQTSETIVSAINTKKETPSLIDESLAERAVKQYLRSYDKIYGGFANAPKFPAPHNLLFLMQQYQKYGDGKLLEMAEKTLLQMYRGGLFDHIGGGFCRYSTDRYYLIPHFEKMLYDNALLIIAYCEAYECTKKELYKNIAEKTAIYVLHEMKSQEGGFYSAQDADSDGEEGKYYVFSPREIKSVLGKDNGKAFCQYYDIREHGNFEGKSIPNLLRTDKFTNTFEVFLPQLRKYRKKRTSLHTDDKVLTLWNSLMIAALCSLYRITCNSSYMQAAKAALKFIEKNLCDKDTLYVSWRDGKHGVKAFLDDYAGYIYALLALYDATLDKKHLNRALQMTEKASAEFFDVEQGGFFLYGNNNETLIARTKESYDGAIPSGNSLMAYNLVRLNHIEANENNESILHKQLRFMSGEAGEYPSGYAMFLMALSDYREPPLTVTVVRENDDLSDLPFHVPSDAIVKVLDAPCQNYKLLNGETAFYVCVNHSCLPPINKDEFYQKFDR